MIVKIELLSDAIFGSGQSIPGAEDIAVLHDEYGFPEISGTNLKGNLREALTNLVAWENREDGIVSKLFGEADQEGYEGEKTEQILVSDFRLPVELREAVHGETEGLSYQEVLELFTNMRTFTSVEKGVVKTGSLRCARCINRGQVFYGEICCGEEDRELVKKALMSLKWLGTMRTRGFGEVRISVEGE